MFFWILFRNDKDNVHPCVTVCLLSVCLSFSRPFSLLLSFSPQKSQSWYNVSPSFLLITMMVSAVTWCLCVNVLLLCCDCCDFHTTSEGYQFPGGIDMIKWKARNWVTGKTRNRPDGVLKLKQCLSVLCTLEIKIYICLFKGELFISFWKLVQWFHVERVQRVLHGTSMDWAGGFRGESWHLSLVSSRFHSRSVILKYMNPSIPPVVLWC